MYAKAVADNQNIHGTAFNFSNRESSYYTEDKAILGEKGDVNIGQIASRKVTAYDEDGVSLLDFNNVKDIAKRITGMTYETLAEKGKLKTFYDAIQTAHSYGIDASQPGNPPLHAI